MMMIIRMKSCLDHDYSCHLCNLTMTDTSEEQEQQQDACKNFEPTTTTATNTKD